MRMHFLTAAALGALLLTPAMAQNTTVQPNNAQSGNQAMPAGAFLQQQTTNEWRGSSLVGSRVMGPDNKTIGDISDLLLDQNGNVQAVVIGVGGFLGLGEKDVAIPFKNLTVVRSSDGRSIDHVSVNYTKDQLKSAPTFKYLNSRL
jgi:sporulation protein YlmC with PRC-barrel domain